MENKKLLIGTLVVILIAILGIGGYLAYKSFYAPQQQVQNQVSEINTCPLKAPEVKGENYNDARVKIVAAGWKPVQTLSNISGMDGNAPTFWQKGYYELESCAGTGLAPCIFLFQDTCGNYLHVSTGGEEYNNYHATVQTTLVNTSKTGGVNPAGISEQNQGIQCKQYTSFSDAISYLKNSNVGVPILLPTQLPKSYTALPASAGKLHISYGAIDGGGYAVAMSLDYNDNNYDCRAGDSNAMGVFMAVTDTVGKPLNFEQGEKISLANGVQGYYFESGRNLDANINWVYNGVYYQALDLHMSKIEAITTVNSAISNAQ